MSIPPKTRGTIYCLLADSLFGFSYLCVRYLTTFEGVSRDWTLCIKEAVTALGVLPIFLILWWRKKDDIPSMKIIALIVLAAFFCQFIGTRSHILAFATIGMMLTNPLVRMFTILGAAILGLVLLREKITAMKWLAIVVLLGSVVMLGISPIYETGSWQSIPPHFLLGFTMTMVTGFGYAVYTIIARYIMKSPTAAGNQTDEVNTKPVSICFLMAVICAFGSLVGGVGLYLDRGAVGFIDVPGSCWGLAFTAGSLNIASFYLRNLSLRYATASKVALFSVIQVLFATLFGITLFQETSNSCVWVGLTLAILGIVLTSRTN